eukprot:Hpha_TRINITY_DN17016_c12_g3::TRINITY_DN17016_c12_g3_i1::g.166782::m.166782
MGGCCSLAWLVRRGDTPDDARIKTTTFPWAALILVFCLYRLVVFRNKDTQNVVVIGTCFLGLGSILVLAGFSTNALRPGYFLDTLLAVCTLGVCAQDLGQAARSSTFRAWPSIVLLLDACLVFKRDHMLYFILPFMLIYNILLQVESVKRFGMYEAGHWGA